MKATGDFFIFAIGCLFGIFLAVWSPSLVILGIRVITYFLVLTILISLVFSARMVPVVKALPEGERNVVGLFQASRTSAKNKSMALQITAALLALTLFAAGIAVASAFTHWSLIK